MFGMISLIFLGQMTGCDRNAKDLVPQPSDKFPGIIEIGQLEVVSPDTLNELVGQSQGALPYIKPSLDAEGQALYDELYPEGTAKPYYFGQLGQAETGKIGGATFTFTATGDDVCLIVDPETVFWSRSIAQNLEEQFAYPDFYNDDGDIDLFAGMSSYYTGSPGVEIGDFRGFYTDSKGELVEIQYGECNQTGYGGVDGAHAGRAKPEFCTIDTDQQEGVEFTVVMETWAVPLDDGVLSFGVAVMNERCPRVDTSECFIRTESLDANGEPKACTDKLEYAQCDGKLASFCCANPEMCGDENVVDAGLCEGLMVVDDEKVTRDAWCEANPALCCDNDEEVEIDGSTGGGGGGPGGPF